MPVNEEENEENKNKLVIVPPTLANIESLTFPIVQQVVLLADFRCKTCQNRVADIISKLNGEAESMEISLMEKQVILTLTRRHPNVTKMSENELRHASIYKNRANQLSLVKKIFRCSSS